MYHFACTVCKLFDADTAIHFVATRIHRESVSRSGGFGLGVLITSCAANSNFILEFSETLRVAAALSPRCSQVVQN